MRYRCRHLPIPPVNKNDLAEKTGSLSGSRYYQLLEGIRLLIEPREVED
jgi:hypothetical protein